MFSRVKGHYVFSAKKCKITVSPKIKFSLCTIMLVSTVIEWYQDTKLISICLFSPRDRDWKESVNLSISGPWWALTVEDKMNGCPPHNTLYHICPNEHVTHLQDKWFAQVGTPRCMNGICVICLQVLSNRTADTHPWCHLSSYLFRQIIMLSTCVLFSSSICTFI